MAHGYTEQEYSEILAVGSSPHSASERPLFGGHTESAHLQWDSPITSTTHDTEVRIALYTCSERVWGM